MATPRTGRPRGRPKGAKNKHSGTRLAKLKRKAKKVEALIDGAFEGDSHSYLMTVYKNPANELAVRIDAAKAALPFERPRLSPVEPKRGADDHVPLAERVKAATRRDAIASSAGKVIELKKTNGHANGHG